MTVGFQEQNGYGRGQGITRSEVEQSTSKIDTRPPCGCASNLRHLATCKTANAALVKFLATLPTELPEAVWVNTFEISGKTICLRVEEVTQRSGVSHTESASRYIEPAQARAVARALLLAADESERANVG